MIVSYRDRRTQDFAAGGASTAFASTINGASASNGLGGRNQNPEGRPLPARGAEPLSLRKGRGFLEFEDGRPVKWNASEIPHVDYAYAMTSYSLQYATAAEVLVHVDCGDSWVGSMLDRSLLYVGASRGANNIRVYTDDKAVLLSENSPVTRFTQKPVALSPAEPEALSMTE